jgi:hypothetical protein
MVAGITTTYAPLPLTQIKWNYTYKQPQQIFQLTW